MFACSAIWVCKMRRIVLTSSNSYRIHMPHRNKIKNKASLAWLDPSLPACECNCDGRVRKRGGEKGLAHFINPRRACAARVTVVGLCVCVCVCVCVCLSTFILELQAAKRNKKCAIVFSVTSARKIMWPILLKLTHWRARDGGRK